MRPDRSTVVLAIVAMALLTGAGVETAAASENDPPLAEAGLDQDVTVDTTVYLDANGSRDPDGQITSVRWSIETPDGATTTPDCRTCRQTTFRPTTTGQYNVTVTVTDDDGATRSDTLYVRTASSDGPSVSLSGPSSATTESSVTITATAESHDAPLSTLAWVVDGSVVRRDSISGESATDTLDRSYDSAGERSVRAVVYDRNGSRGEATTTLAIAEPVRPAGGATQASGGSGGSSNDCHFAKGTCLADLTATVVNSGEERIYDSNGDGRITIITADGFVDASTVVDKKKYKRNGGYDATIVSAVRNGIVLKNGKSENNQESNSGTDQSLETGDGASVNNAARHANSVLGTSDDSSSAESDSSEDGFNDGSGYSYSSGGGGSGGDGGGASAPSGGDSGSSNDDNDSSGNSDSGSSGGSDSSDGGSNGSGYSGWGRL